MCLFVCLWQGSRVISQSVSQTRTYHQINPVAHTQDTAMVILCFLGFQFDRTRRGSFGVPSNAPANLTTIATEEPGKALLFDHPCRVVQQSPVTQLPAMLARR